MPPRRSNRVSSASASASDSEPDFHAAASGAGPRTRGGRTSAPRAAKRQKAIIDSEDEDEDEDEGVEGEEEEEEDAEGEDAEGEDELEEEDAEGSEEDVPAADDDAEASDELDLVSSGPSRPSHPAPVAAPTQLGINAKSTLKTKPPKSGLPARSTSTTIPAPAPVSATTTATGASGSQSKGQVKIKLRVPSISSAATGAGTPAGPAPGSKAGGGGGAAGGAGGGAGNVPPPRTAPQGGRPPRAAAKKAGRKSKEVARGMEMASDEDELDLDPEGMDELDPSLDPIGGPGADMELDLDAEGEDEEDEYFGAGSRSVSPSKMTARQRAKGNKDLQGGLMALPNEPSKKLVLTEAERLQRREEIARRRKRQSEQKLQDEQDQTINRLLRAQTGRSRAKLVQPGEEGDGLGPESVGGPGMGNGGGTTGRGANEVREGWTRWVCQIEGGEVKVRMGVPDKATLGGKAMFA